MYEKSPNWGHKKEEGQSGDCPSGVGGFRSRDDRNLDEHPDANRGDVPARPGFHGGFESPLLNRLLRGTDERRVETALDGSVRNDEAVLLDDDPQNDLLLRWHTGRQLGRNAGDQLGKSDSRGVGQVENLLAPCFRRNRQKKGENDDGETRLLHNSLLAAECVGVLHEHLSVL